MKTIRNFALKWGGTIAALALVIATYSAGATCIFTAYQPNMPEQLRDRKDNT